MYSMVLQPQQTHWGLNEQWAGLSVLECCSGGADRRDMPANPALPGEAEPCDLLCSMGPAQTLVQS